MHSHVNSTLHLIAQPSKNICRSQNQYAAPAAKHKVLTEDPIREATTRTLADNVFYKLEENRSTTKKHRMTRMFRACRLVLSSGAVAVAALA